LYGLEVWCHTFREEHRLRVFEKRALKEIFLLLKRGETRERWRRHHDEELHNFNSLRNIIKMIKSNWSRWAGHVEKLESSTPAGNTPLERPS
jgi:hypothetical protein